MKTIVFTLIGFCFLTLTGWSQSSGKFTDPRDQKEYYWIKLGPQTWMAQNLNHPVGEGGYIYNDDSIQAAKYGHHYTWTAAQKACPKGWKLPSEKDWHALIATLGEDKAGQIVQSLDTVGKAAGRVTDWTWTGMPNLLSGIRYPDGRFLNLTFWGGCWTSTAVNDSVAVNVLFVRKSGEIGFSTNDKKAGFTVRCIRK